MKLPFVWELDNNGTISHLIGTLHRIGNVYSSAIDTLLEGKTKTLLEFAASDEDVAAYHKNRRKNHRLELLHYFHRQSLKGENTLYQQLVEMDNQDRINLLDDLRKEENQAVLEHDDPVILDIIIQDRSKAFNIPVFGIESTAMTAEVREWNEKHHSVNTRADQKKYFDAYRAGDLPRFLQELRHIERDWLYTGTAEWNLNSRRNKEMAERSVEQLSTPCLVGIGIAHLIEFAPTLIQAYQEKGIKVKRIK